MLSSEMQAAMKIIFKTNFFLIIFILDIGLQENMAGKCLQDGRHKGAAGIGRSSTRTLGVFH
jgi:hypothetical protein